METSAKNVRTVIFEQTGEAEVLTVKDILVPAPGANEVRIKTKALGLNRADAMYRRGAYLEHPVFPAKLGYEAAGIVESVGADVRDVKAGDRVSVIPAFSLNKYAMHGELVVAPAYAVERIPDWLDFKDAAALWSTYLTAYGLLVDQAQVSAGQYVLINAASSGVGLSAIQIANAAGAIPIALSTSSSKKQALLEAGAAHVIVTKDQDVVAEVNSITNGKGANVILDAVGGNDFGALLSAAAFKGKILIYGTLSPDATNIITWDILRKNLTINGFTVADVNATPARLHAAKKFIYQGLENHKLHPVVAEEFHLDDMVEAHKFLESNKQVGKIIVTL
jgi:NADPH:quinone reductase-like Zn-dependent oxidoreductase